MGIPKHEERFPAEPLPLIGLEEEETASQEQGYKDLLTTLLSQVEEEEARLLLGRQDSLVQVACHVCDTPTCWYCPRCKHYACTECAAWEDDDGDEGEGEEESDVVRCCDVCDTHLEMMVH